MTLVFSDELKSFFSNHSFEEVFQLKGKTFREATGRKTLKIQIDDGTYFLKLHTGVGWKEIFKNIFTFRWPVLGAKTEYHAIQRIKTLGISTPVVVAYGEKGWNPAKKKSFIITKEIVYEDNLEDWLEKHGMPPFKLKRLVIKRVAQIAKTLHQNHINHRDLYLCHFLLNHSGDDFKLYLIDLHRVQMHLTFKPRWIIKDLSALYFSALPFAFSRSDYFYFIRCYTNERPRNAIRQNRQFWNAVHKRALGTLKKD
ncbi:MAG: lipopolysaccharide core heptose(I) kinase RfaP [Gammaproteobacteria bacterium]